MYKIRIGNHQYKRLYAWTEDPAEAIKIMQEYVKKQEVDGFKSYYWNVSMHDDEKLFIIDYGKYSDFLFLNCDTQEEYNNYLKL